jgi:hypothetical protein
LLRVLVTGVLSIVLVPIAWAAMLFVSPGAMVVQYVLPVGGNGDMLGGLNTAVAVDFTVWFSALWGIQTLWARLHEQLEERGVERAGPIRCDATTAVSAALCSLPLSFYVVFVADIFLNRGRLPDSGLLFTGAVMLSLAACVIAVLGLFAAAVQFWPRRAM